MFISYFKINLECIDHSSYIYNMKAKRTQGMNWISQHKRLAIYLRDGLCCAYCNKGIEAGVKLTLDHLKPYSKGGSNEATNLVTCCLECNSSRGNSSYTKFAASADTIAFIRKTVKRVLDTQYAKQLVEQRGSCKNVVNNMK